MPPQAPREGALQQALSPHAEVWRRRLHEETGAEEARTIAVVIWLIALTVVLTAAIALQFVRNRATEELAGRIVETVNTHTDRLSQAEEELQDHIFRSQIAGNPKRKDGH